MRTSRVNAGAGKPAIVTVDGEFTCPDCGTTHRRGPMLGNAMVYRCLRCGKFSAAPHPPPVGGEGISPTPDYLRKLAACAPLADNDAGLDEISRSLIGAAKLIEAMQPPADGPFDATEHNRLLSEAWALIAPCITCAVVSPEWQAAADHWGVEWHKHCRTSVRAALSPGKVIGNGET